MSWPTIFSLIIVLIGFFALVCSIVLISKQKIITDAEGSFIEVALPFFGKVRTNYPSVIILIVGVGLIYWAAGPFIEKKSYEKWDVSGVVRFDSTFHKRVSLGNLRLAVEPRLGFIDDGGILQLQVLVPIEEGQRVFPNYVKVEHDSIRSLSFTLDTTSTLGKKINKTITGTKIELIDTLVIRPISN